MVLENFENVNSYAFDNDTGAELFLINNKSELYLKEGSYSLKIEDIKNIDEIHPPLVKFNSSYYFCCSSFQQLIEIKEDKINIIENPNEMNKTKDFKIRFF